MTIYTSAVTQKTSKAPSTPTTMLKQRSTLSNNIRLCCQKTATMSNEFIVEYRSFDKVECCLDIVAVFGNNVERVFREILSFRQSQNKIN